MAAPFRVQKSELPLPHTRVCHVAVTWNNATLVWGGIRSTWGPNAGLFATSEVYVHLDGKWTKKETSGDVPGISQNAMGAMAHVVDDNMLVFGYEDGAADGYESVYTLNLNSWTWTKLTPHGIPSKTRHRASSWLHNGNVYIFGGSEVVLDHEDEEIYFKYSTETLQYYSIPQNSWEWASQEGEIPSERNDPCTVISGNNVYLFGGAGDDGVGEVFNDLHILDMDTMRWTRVHGNISNDFSGPLETYFRMYSLNMSKRKLTLISRSSAVLFDAHNCWLLSLDNAKRLMDKSAIWTRLRNDLCRAHFATVLEPVTRSLWILGGFDLEYRRYRASGFPRKAPVSSDVLIMPLNPWPSLQDRAIATVARTHCVYDPKLARGNIPPQFRDAIEEYRKHVGGKYACSKKEGCNRCSRLIPCMLGLEPRRKKAKND